MLSISNPDVSMGGKPSFNGLTLDVPAGDLRALMGPNGTGDRVTVE